MARLLSSGFELNSATDTVEYLVLNNSLTISSSIVFSGNYSLKVSGLTSLARRGARFQFVSNAGGDGPYYARANFRCITFPTAENRILGFFGVSNLFYSYITIDNSGIIKLYDEDGQITGTVTISLNTNYLLEFKDDFTGAGSNDIVEAKCNGILFANSSTRNLSDKLHSIVFGGNLNYEDQTTGEWYFDNIAINDSTGSFQNSYPGEGKIIHLKPNAAGDYSDWTNSYTNVDEVTPNDDTDLVSSNTLDQKDDHHIESPTMLGDQDTINVVQVGVRFNGAGASANASFTLRCTMNGTTEEQGTLTPSNATWVTNAAAAPRNYSYTLYDLPGASTGGITKNDLETAQIGYRLSATSTNAAQISTVWLLVDYTPVTVKKWGVKPR